MVKPRIGLLPIGHFYYWDQFPRLRDMGLNMYAKLRESLEKIDDIFAPELMDTMEKFQRPASSFDSIILIL